MDWTTLISVVIGGLIATIPVLISSIFQAREKKKDREEQRREARIRVTEETIGSDIDKAMNLLAEFMNKLSEDMFMQKMMFTKKDRMADIETRVDEIAEEVKKKFDIPEEIQWEQELKEMKKEYEVFFKDDKFSARKAFSTLHTMYVLIYSLDGEIVAAHTKLLECSSIFMVSLAKALKSNDEEGLDLTEKWDNTAFAAGNLQRLLREKKISIRA